MPWRIAQSPEPLSRLHAREITRRLPVFAAIWLGLAVTWEGVQIALGRVPPPVSAAYLGVVLLLLAGAVAIARRDPAAARVRWVALVVCVLLCLASAARNALFEGQGEPVAFAMFIVCLASSLLFAWGWRTAALLAGSTLAIWLLARPSLVLFVAPEELLVGSVFGSIVWVAVAEASARSLQRAWREDHARRQTMHELALSRDAYRDLAENASDLIYTHDLDTRLTYVNAAFARYFGVARAALIGKTAEDLIDRSRPNPDPASIVARLVAGETVPPATFAVTVGGEERWAECVVSAIRDVDGSVIGVRGIARDVTARVRAQEALRASYEEVRRQEAAVRRLARRQSEIREEERRRLGVDLHDGVCQELVGIGFDLELLRHEIGAPSPVVASRIARLERYVTGIVEHLRLLAHDLRPMVLLDLGLEESLRALARGMSSEATRVEVAVPAPLPPLEEETALGIYRIVQEALANAARHARARAITVTLAVRDERVRLEVRDDGCGFATDDRRGGDTVGLVSMLERARALGGRLEIHSQPGAGCRVVLDCPVRPRAVAA